MDGAEIEQIRRARAKFAAMAATYCLGAFNDNFFKQAACLIAIFAGRPRLQGEIVVVFSLPWLLLAAPAGWLADRFPKHRVVILAKALELAAMVCGAVGIVTGNWVLILGMMFLMALQSTIFSPALNGSIPELYPTWYVLRANAVMKMLTTAGVLAGVILAGVVLKYKAPAWGVAVGQLTVAALVVGISLLGLAVSFGVNRRPAAHPGARFPWSGPIDTVRQLWRTRRDRLLAVTIAADAYVWFAALLQVLIVNQFGKAYGLDEQQTSYLLIPELLGVVAGGALARYLASGSRWHRVLLPGMVALAAFTSLLAVLPKLPAPAQLPSAAGLLLCSGVAGGLLLVPLESFFQVRPAARDKGAVISAANFAAFFSMLLAGAADMSMTAAGVDPPWRFGLLGALTLLVALALPWALRGEGRA